MSFMTPYEVYFDLCKTFDTPRSLSAALLLQAGEFEQFLSLDVKPLDYLQHDVAKFRNDYFVSEYLSKYTGHEAGVDTAAVALSGFIAAEEQCRLANRRLADFNLASGPVNDEIPSGLDAIIHRAQALILRALGEKPDYDMFARCCKWGSGTTYSIPGYKVRVDNKVRENQISITRSAIRYFRYALCEDTPFMNARRIPAEGPASLMSREFKIVHGGKGMTVPKNAKTDRFICNEPSGNIFLQLGAGKLIRLALKRVGINLNDQTINQELARLAVSLGLATVDMKSASDTICRAIVWLLLPPAWVRLLDDLRSPFIEVDDHWIEAEKFSAMGNGFTFELESLIFWALTTATRDHLDVKGRISVYGDDIICPQEIVPVLKTVFSYVGFTFNVKKTHLHSGFRESCGKHYFWGSDVSPVYQKERVAEIDTAAPNMLAAMSTFYRYRNRLLYWAVDRIDVSVNSVVYADSVVRRIIKRLDLYMGNLPKGASVLHVPIVSDQRRDLSSGLAVSSSCESLKLKWHGWSFSTKALSFAAPKEPCHTGAIYSVYMRTRAQCPDDLIPYFTVRDTHRLFKGSYYKGRPCRHPVLQNDVLNDFRRIVGLSYNLPEAYAGEIAQRDFEGLAYDSSLMQDKVVWRIGRSYYDEPLVLSWQSDRVTPVSTRYLFIE